MPESLPPATAILPLGESPRSVAVIVRRGADQAADVEEALRVALGQTLAAGEVTVIFVDDGVWAAAAPPHSGGPGADITNHLEMLAELGHEVVAEAGALEARGVRCVRSHVAVRPREEILARLARMRVILAL